MLSCLVPLCDEGMSSAFVVLILMMSQLAATSGFFENLCLDFRRKSWLQLPSERNAQRQSSEIVSPIAWVDNVVSVDDTSIPISVESPGDVTTATESVPMSTPGSSDSVATTVNVFVALQDS